MLFSSESLDFWESFANWGSVLVIVGVVGESIDIAAKWYSRLRKRRPVKWVVRWLLPWESIFWLILCIGLGMEFCGGWKSRLISRQENARLVAIAGDVEQKAGEANESAAQANERAATLEKEAADERLAVENTQKSMLLMQTLMAVQAPDLSKTFPLGYSLLTVSGINTVTPFVDASGKSIVANWDTCKVLENTPEFIKLQIPDLKVAGSDMLFRENYVILQNKPGYGLEMAFPDPETWKNFSVTRGNLGSLWGPKSFSKPGFALVIAILQIANNSRIIVIGIKPPGPENVPEPYRGMNIGRKP